MMNRLFSNKKFDRFEWNFNRRATSPPVIKGGRIIVPWEEMRGKKGD